jgi:exodeoxyribonuclease VII small subunit
MAKQTAKLTFEDALARLEQIVDQLDDGNLPLAKSLELFKEGTKLAALCRDLLSQAELTVKQALDGRSGDDAARERFTDEEAAETNDAEEEKT